MTKNNGAKKSGKSLYVVALLLFLGGLGSLMYTGFTEDSVYFLNVSEALAQPTENLKAARLFGTVAERDLVRSEDGGQVRFLLEDKDHPGQTLTVSFKGAVPDTFRPGAEVIVEGGLGSLEPAAADNVFVARSLMTKCPSKYQKENRG